MTETVDVIRPRAPPDDNSPFTVKCTLDSSDVRLIMKPRDSDTITRLGGAEHQDDSGHKLLSCLECSVDCRGAEHHLGLWLKDRQRNPTVTFEVQLSEHSDEEKEVLRGFGLQNKSMTWSTVLTNGHKYCSWCLNEMRRHCPVCKQWPVNGSFTTHKFRGSTCPGAGSCRVGVKRASPQGTDAGAK